jgi:hypothetical protein
MLATRCGPSARGQTHLGEGGDELPARQAVHEDGAWITDVALIPHHDPNLTPSDHPLRSTFVEGDPARRRKTLADLTRDSGKDVDLATAFVSEPETNADVIVVLDLERLERTEPRGGGEAHVAYHS